MGYDASVGGYCYLRPLTEEEKNQICAQLADMLGHTYPAPKWPEIATPILDCPFITETEDGVEINVCGYDRYHGDDWENFYGILKPYLDFTKDNSFEFVGEDNSTWRFRFTENGLMEDEGCTVYDNEIPYAVCIRESCVRDAQIRTSCPDDEEDWEDEDFWTDCSGPIFVKMVRADSRKEAINKVAEEEGYDVSILEAYTC